MSVTLCADWLLTVTSKSKSLKLNKCRILTCEANVLDSVHNWRQKLIWNFCIELLMSLAENLSYYVINLSTIEFD